VEGGEGGEKAHASPSIPIGLPRHFNVDAGAKDSVGEDDARPVYG